jgi:hypothetical protein
MNIAILFAVGLSCSGRIRSLLLYLSLLGQDDDLYGDSRMESTPAEGHVIAGLPNHVDKVMQVHLPNMESFIKIYSCKEPST